MFVCKFYIISLTIERFIFIMLVRGDYMTIPQKIKMALAYKGMSESELARPIGSSPQAFNQRMKTGKFSSEDLASIAAALQATFFFGFEFEDGTKI